MPWRGLEEWWLEEVIDDPAYEEVVTPLLMDVLAPQAGLSYLDVGSGEGRVSRAVEARGASCVGVEVNEALAHRSRVLAVAGRACMLPIADGSFDGVFLVLVLEHVKNHAGVFAEAARVTRSGGVLAVVLNHPVWTAPGSTPITDGGGEVLWRPGEYFSNESSEMPAGEGSVTFHHRTMSSLLSAAASAGWCLEAMIEQPHHDFEDQAGIPRLLACRWSLLP